MQPLILLIRSKSREQWEEYAYELYTDLRIWIQEHGEKASIVCLLLGILITQIFKFFMLLVVLAVLAAAVVWYIALPQVNQDQNQTNTSSDALNPEVINDKDPTKS